MTSRWSKMVRTFGTQRLTGEAWVRIIFLEIGHDKHYQTLYNVTDYILTSLKEKGYGTVTVVSVLGMRMRICTGKAREGRNAYLMQSVWDDGSMGM